MEAVHTYCRLLIRDMMHILYNHSPTLKYGESDCSWPVWTEGSVKNISSDKSEHKIRAFTVYSTDRYIESYCYILHKKQEYQGKTWRVCWSSLFSHSTMTTVGEIITREAAYCRNWAKVTKVYEYMTELTTVSYISVFWLKNSVDYNNCAWVW